MYTSMQWRRHFQTHAWPGASLTILAVPKPLLPCAGICHRQRFRSFLSRLERNDWLRCCPWSSGSGDGCGRRSSNVPCWCRLLLCCCSCLPSDGVAGAASYTRNLVPRGEQGPLPSAHRGSNTTIAALDSPGPIAGTIRPRRRCHWLLETQNTFCKQRTRFSMEQTTMAYKNTRWPLFTIPLCTAKLFQ